MREEKQCGTEHFHVYSLINVFLCAVTLLAAGDLIVNKKDPVTCWGLVRKTKLLSTQGACIVNKKQMCQCIYKIIINCSKFSEKQVGSYW